MALPAHTQEPDTPALDGQQPLPGRRPDAGVAVESVEVTGQVVAPWPEPGLPEAASPAADPSAERSLQLLALDTLAEVARIRDLLAEREAAVATLREEVAVWEARASTLSSARAREKLAAERRERELVTVLHRAITEGDALRAELDWRRRPWWRRGRRPLAAQPTPAQLLASAAR